MNIYHVIRTDLEKGKTVYDTYSDFVCLAESEEDARRTFPREELIPFESCHIGFDGLIYLTDYKGVVEPIDSLVWVKDIAFLEVRLLGFAPVGSSAGVVCASYHAG